MNLVRLVWYVLMSTLMFCSHLISTATNPTNVHLRHLGECGGGGSTLTSTYTSYRHSPLPGALCEVRKDRFPLPTAHERHCVFSACITPLHRLLARPCRVQADSFPPEIPPHIHTRVFASGVDPSSLQPPCSARLSHQHALRITPSWQRMRSRVAMSTRQPIR